MNKDWIRQWAYILGLLGYFGMAIMGMIAFVSALAYYVTNV